MTSVRRLPTTSPTTRAATSSRRSAVAGAREIVDAVPLIQVDGAKLEVGVGIATGEAFVGNIDVRILEKGDPDAIRREVRHKLQAARGGGYVFQSDHSVSSNVTPESYELAIATLRELGDYPLQV